MISFCCARKLSCCLARAKLCPLEGSVDSFKCKNKCYLVWLKIKETDSSFMNYSTNERRKLMEGLFAVISALFFLLHLL